MAATESTLDSPIAENIRAGTFRAEMEQRLKAEATARGAIALFLELVEGIDPGTLETYRAEYRAWPIDRWKKEIPQIIINAKERLSKQNNRLQALMAQRNDEKAAHARTQALLAAEQAESDRLRKLLRTATQVRPGPEAAADSSFTADSYVVTRSDPTTAPQLELLPPDAIPTAVPQSPQVTLVLPEQIPDGWEFTTKGTGEEDLRNDYEVKAYLIGVIGATGRCSRKWLKAHTAQFLRNPRSMSTIDRAIRNCGNVGWIQIVECDAAWAKGAPHLVRLTEKGEAWYRRLFDADPIVNDLTRLLDEHAPNGETHAVLCVAAADQLERLGARVQILPPAREFGAHRFQPDLHVVTNDEETWHIECERATGPAEGRRPKWVNALTLDGEVYIVAPDPRLRDLLVSEVLALGKRCRVYATDIQTLQQTKPGKVWATVKESIQGDLPRT